MIDGTDTAKQGSHWTVVVRVLSYEGRIYVPVTDSLPGKVRSLFHDNPESGHLEALKTTELACRDFYWRAMDLCVHKYISGCEVCQRIEARRHARHGINMPLETPSWPSEGVTIDLVTDWQQSTALGNTGILVIVD